MVNYQNNRVVILSTQRIILDLSREGFVISITMFSFVVAPESENTKPGVSMKVTFAHEAYS